MGQKRNNRLSGEMKKVISDIIRTQVKDPRMSDMLSITEVHVTDDLKYAKVYVSVYGDIKPTLEALQSAKGFIRREVGRQIKMRITPELVFEQDNSIEKGIYLSSLISKVRFEEEAGKKNDNEPC